MKCKHCEKVWSVAHSSFIPTECPFCGQKLEIVCQNAATTASIYDAVMMIVDTYGESILQNRTLFLALLGDLAPHLKKERKILSTAMTTDVMKLIEKCPENEQTKRIGIIHSMLDVLSEDAIALFINSMGQCVGWSIQQAVPAEETVEQKAQRGDKDAIMMMVKQCSDAGDIESAVEWAKKGAAVGIVKAAHLLGICYNEGLGIPENKQESERWLKFAAEHGEMDAAAYLGKVLKANRPNDAERWLLMSAQAGHAESMHFLSHIYRDQKKTKDALVWAQKALAAGDMESTLMCAVLLSELNTKESVEKALQYSRQFLNLAKKEHPLYQSAELFVNQLVEQEKKLNQPIPAPTPAVPKEKALTAVLYPFMNELSTGINACYFMDSVDYRTDYAYKKKIDKKIRNAIKTYAPGAENQRIYMLEDSTLFGNAKEGFLLTDQYLYAKVMLEKSVSIPLHSIKNIRMHFTNSLNSIFVDYVRENTTSATTAAILGWSGNDFENEKAKKIVSLLKGFVQKIKEYDGQSPQLQTAGILDSIKPYLDSLFDADEMVCVYSKKSKHYYGQEAYRIIVADLLRDGMPMLSQQQQVQLQKEEILAFTAVSGTSGFFLTQEHLYTPRGTMDISAVTRFDILDSTTLSILRAYYQDGGREKELILYMALSADSGRLRKIKVMLEAFLQASKQH